MRITEAQLESATSAVSTEDWEARLGIQFRDARLGAGIDQADLASRTGLSIGAIRALERGTGSSLKTVVRVARELGRDDWLASLAPAVTVSPIDIARRGRRERTRVYRPRAPRRDGDA